VSASRLEVRAGGTPTPAQLAALSAAAAALVEDGRHEDDPLPAAYRSRWRRAGMVENTQVPSRVKDGGPGWEGLA
jgi:hypothetical protein